MIKEKFVRKKLLVDKKFQTKFMLNFFISFVIIILLLSILFIYSTSHQIKGSVYKKLVSIKNTNQIIIPVVIKISALILIFGGSFALYNLLRYSNHIVGPMVRFKRCLKKIGNGNLTITLNFRKKDQLHELANLLTETSKQLNKKIKTLKKHFISLKKLIKEKGVKKINKKEIQTLENAVDTIEFILKNFKTN